MCRAHGGLSTGPKTPAGRAVSGMRFFDHGRESRACRAERAAQSAVILQIEDILSLYGLLSRGRTRGRKPRGYVRVESLEQARFWLLNL
jgi:hypothetical protein